MRMLTRVLSQFPYFLSQRLIVCHASTVPSNVKDTIRRKKNEDMLETIDIEDLPRAQKRFAKQFEKVNEERVKEIFAKNYKNQIALFALITLVIGIYYYTIHAVKQETFLEEIDEEMAVEHPSTHEHLQPSLKK
uniref:Cytochrome c oxidase assembly factor 3 n=1 Tax=Heterorhabditis bacteriophora TaxID=37862 RepID=A0A1I7W7A1_HETBA